MNEITLLAADQRELLQMPVNSGMFFFFSKSESLSHPNTLAREENEQPDSQNGWKPSIPKRVAPKLLIQFLIMFFLSRNWNEEAGANAKKNSSHHT